MEVKGYVYYSPNSCAVDITEDTETTGSGYEAITIHAQHPIPNIPIILISLINDIETEYACVKTDENGKYSFTNVELGKYIVIEAFDCKQYCGQGTIDFTAEKKPLNGITFTPKDPTIEYILTQGYETYGGNRIVSIYPNKVPIEVRESNIWDLAYYPVKICDRIDFKDAPQRCEPLVISDFLPFQNSVIIGENLIQSVDKGTFGSVPAGSGSSGYFSNSYASEDFTAFSPTKYGPEAPQRDHFAITNIAARSSFNKSWFDSADHTIGDETGRFMIVNGDDKGKAFFKNNINIESNTVYLFSCWAMNILRFPDSVLPEFSIKIYDSTTDEQLFYSIFNKDHPMHVTDIPTWRQIGTILTPEDLLNRTNLTIEFKSEAMEASGNDYAVDDITIVALKRGVVVQKSIVPEKENVELGQEINYVCTITNSNDGENVTHLMFKDLIQEGVTIKDNTIFISCSDIKDQPYILDTPANPNVRIDNVGIDVGELLAEYVSASDPYYIPFKLEIIPPGVTITIKFTVIVNSVNKTAPYNNVKNRFRIQFLSELDSQDTDRPRTVASNEVITPVIFPELKFEKSLSKIINGIATEVSQGGSIYLGDEILYSIKITNSGKASADNITISDEFDELFLYEFPDKIPDCAIQVTKQIISPDELKQEDEQQVPCSDISPFGSNGIQIKNISVPAATENEDGVCIVRIYGKVKS